MLYWRGPNTEKLEPQFQQAMELAGPQHREFRKEIQPAMEVGVNKLIL
ncbi:nitrogen regulation protein NIFR3 [Staphylococcus aureus]|nr:nitrogen regulation protein NIFR3 [Staphylococcus aureus]